MKIFNKWLWTQFQCTGTKFFGPCSSAQGRKFWTLFQCTGTKNFGPCSSAQGRKCFAYFNGEHLSSIQWWECHFISRFHWETKLSMRETKLSMGRQSSVQCYVPEVTQKTTSCPGKFIHTSTAFRATRLHVNSNIWQTFLSRGSTKNDESRDWNTKYNLQESALGKREIRCTSYNGMDKSGHQIDECANWHCINENDNKCINITHNNSL